MTKGKGTYSKVSASKSSRKKAANKTQTVKKKVYPAHISGLAKELGINPSSLKYSDNIYGLDVFVDIETGNSWMVAYDTDLINEAIIQYYEELYDDMGFEAFNADDIEFYLDKDAINDLVLEIGTEDLSNLDHYDMIESYGTADIEKIKESIKAEIEHLGAFGYLEEQYGKEQAMETIKANIDNPLDFETIARDVQMSTSAGSILGRINDDDLEFITKEGWMYAFQYEDGYGEPSERTVYKGLGEGKIAFKSISKNIITDEPIGYGTLSRKKKIYYEIAKDSSPMSNLHGVSVGQIVGGRLEMTGDLSESFHSLDEAEAYAEKLHKKLGDK